MKFLVGFFQKKLTQNKGLYHMNIKMEEPSVVMLTKVGINMFLA